MIIRGLTFNGSEFDFFSKVFAVKHRLITPNWPRVNGEVEQLNRNFTKVMRNSEVKGISWKKELNTFLGTYRSTPHYSTGVARARLIFKFNTCSKLERMRRQVTNGDDLDKIVRERTLEAK